MGIRDALHAIFAGSDPDSLESILAALGIDAASANYHPPSRAIVLSLKIHGQTRHAMIPVGIVLDRADICKAIAAGSLGDAPASASADQAKPPPEKSAP